MPLILHNGKLITKNGKLIKDKTCCCNQPTCYSSHCVRIPSIVKVKLTDTQGAFRSCFGIDNNVTVLCGDTCCVNVFGGGGFFNIGPHCNPHEISNVCGPSQFDSSFNLRIGWRATFPDIGPIYPTAGPPYNSVMRRRYLFVNLFLRDFLEQLEDVAPWRAYIFAYYQAIDFFSVPPTFPGPPPVTCGGNNQCGALLVGFGKQVLFDPKPTDCVNLMKNVTLPYGDYFAPVDPDLKVLVTNDE